MHYEWDEAKRQQNIAKHGLDFLDAVAVLESPALLVIADTRHDYREARLIGFGPLADRLCVVVHVERTADCIRIVSFRKANRREIHFYDEHTKA